MSLSNIARYAALTGALATPLALATIPSASATSGGTGAAYGIAAAGLVNIPPTPSVQAPAANRLASLPANPLIDLSLLKVVATPGHASAKVLDLHLIGAGRASAVRAEVITARCDEGRGSSSLVGVSIAGHKLAAHAAPNSAVSIPVQGLGTVSVTLNKQVRTADGGLTVTALEIGLPLGPGKRQVIDVSSASCSAGAAPAPGEAPKPTPVPSNLPVTG